MANDLVIRQTLLVLFLTQLLITVIAVGGPTASCQSQGLRVQLDGNGDASITAAEIDDGSVAGSGESINSLTIAPSTFDCDDVGTGGNTVTLTVTDTGGNSDTCQSFVFVEDDIAPTAVCSGMSLSLDGNGDASITAADIDDGSDDVCGISSLTIVPSSFTCVDIGDNTVTLTVTDINSNTATCTSTVTVEGNKICKVEICHKGKNTITVSPNALKAHLAHGDVKGACSGGNVVEDEDEYEGLDVDTDADAAVMKNDNNNADIFGIKDAQSVETYSILTVIIIAGIVILVVLTCGVYQYAQKRKVVKEPNSIEMNQNKEYDIDQQPLYQTEIVTDITD